MKEIDASNSSITLSRRSFLIASAAGVAWLAIRERGKGRERGRP
ncbi:Tat pathway signal sequence domain protein [delta proteobacterium NaphS2]|nr:Tat pathway signal sequence domain protein [delta proteobacterium NaphS2]